MEQLTKKFYRIGDVSELLGLPQSTIRFWEKEFSELRPRRNGGGTRMYTPSDIEQLRIIKFLIKDKGLTLEGAREHQNYAQEVINVICHYRGNIVAGKRIMKLTGLDLGPNRVPFQNMTDEEEEAMRAELDAIDFFCRCNKV